ncbi:AAHS family 4-hydroxybenzoate transporter-like MFS transporter [Altererythrobacter atlanticus]|uniref:4-hydroxybenzoate transporter PcaK n=1 Tax=Croceibacterium atlanticum TaxID=1267766 RepID=A0A0F7KYR3_9SPHN|nr:MFS transporter [Croceibacterium atlanticum]AKH43955.1 4-hydroxybenzoate transporter PcaK [Croceibacterium atlanticum]MBB5733595.1 AAHS family 4-hydroxybenzoate transporter-like MFS transporter [Croceibacterium atlanticum]
MNAATAFDRRTLIPLILCGLVMFIDGYDLNAMPLVVPYLVEELGAAPEQFSWALSAVLLGLGIGAIVLAPLGDRIGRRPMILLATGVMAVTTLGTATGSTITEFTLWRLATGLGLGACLPNVTALVAEIAPAGRGARTLTIVSMGIALGGIAAGLLAPPLVSLAGWHGLFIFGGAATFALLLALMLLLPESPKLERPEVAPGSKRQVAFVQLLRPPLLFSTALFAGLYAVNALVLYLIVSWVPTVLPAAGISVDTASRFLSLIQFGGLIIGLGLSLLLDRGWAVRALIATYSCAAAALLMFGLFQPDPFSWGVLLLIAGGGISAAHLAIMAVAVGFFPPHLLSSAIGIAVAVARLGAIGGPVVGGAVIGAGASTATFFAFAALPAFLCIGAVLLIPRARRGAEALAAPEAANPTAD